MVELVDSILVMDPAKRPTASQVLAHPFFDPVRQPELEVVFAILWSLFPRWWVFPSCLHVRPCAVLVGAQVEMDPDMVAGVEPSPDLNEYQIKRELHYIFPPSPTEICRLR